ncbi:hypothetical protein E2C01_062696 [Portunus trituberculatus]|uniref:Uncharacterized protein n=1 Tax=Portunus trituberculatus TaxID=210409 RepID=A0A5B7HIR6_PORTR|nr:hypothetical protein [Portunus trituberculatus]
MSAELYLFWTNIAVNLDFRLLLTQHQLYTSLTFLHSSILSFSSVFSIIKLFGFSMILESTCFMHLNSFSRFTSLLTLPLSSQNPENSLYSPISSIQQTAARTRRRCTVFWGQGILGQIWISTMLLLIASTTIPGA